MGEDLVLNPRDSAQRNNGYLPHKQWLEQEHGNEGTFAQFFKGSCKNEVEKVPGISFIDSTP